MVNEKKEGLYWTQYGGNGEKTMWASTHVYTSVVKDEETGVLTEESILVDLGAFVGAKLEKFDGEKGKYNRVFPDVSSHIDTPGYENNLPKAKALLLTHGHADHISGVVEYALMGAKLPPIYASEYTLKMLEDAFTVRGLDWQKFIDPANVHEIKSKDVIQIGNMTIEAGSAPHSIPGSLCFKISTPKATVFHSGDMKTEKKSYIREGVDFSHLEKMGQDGIDFAVMDACDATKDGHDFTETQLHDAYVDAFTGEGKNRQVVAVVPAGHLERIATVLQAAKDAGRDVVIDGGPQMYAHILGIGLEEFYEKFPNIKSAETVKDRTNAVLITTGVHGLKDGENSEQSPFVDALVRGEKYDKIDDNALVIVGHYKQDLPKMIADSKLYPDATVWTGGERPVFHIPGHAQMEGLLDIVEMMNVQHMTCVHTVRKINDEFRKQIQEKTEKKERKKIPELLSEDTYNGYTVHIVSGQKPEIVSKQDVKAFCCKHDEISVPLPCPPYEKIMFKGATSYDHRYYYDLSINQSVDGKTEGEKQKTQEAVEKTETTVEKRKKMGRILLNKQRFLNKKLKLSKQQTAKIYAMKKSGNEK